MQCQCGGEAKTKVKPFVEGQEAKCLEEAFPHKPEKYPCVVHRAKCDCGRQSVHITYNLGGLSGKGIHEGFLKKKKPEPITKTRKLF